MSLFSKVKAEIEKLWKDEEPTIEGALKDALSAVEPVWKTALGKIVMSTVVNLSGLAASQGGAAAAKEAAATIAKAAEGAGVAASKSTINTLIELAVGKLSQYASPTTPSA